MNVSVIKEENFRRILISDSEAAVTREILVKENSTVLSDLNSILYVAVRLKFRRWINKGKKIFI
ncbi:MAG: hypothetical protein WC055_15020 [Melioribacteraceae bacterium]